MKKFVTLCALTGLLAACTTTNPYTGQTQTSKAVWGTAIGAATGAATGALVAKKSGAGAIVGGLAGAAVGGGESRRVGALADAFDDLPADCLLEGGDGA